MEAIRASLEAHGATTELVEAAPGLRGTLVVVDSYRVRADERSIVAERGLVAIDDLCRDLDVDLVVDPNPAALPAEHPRARRALTGAKYAIVDPQLSTLEPADPTRDPRRVLVTMGASTTGANAVAAEVRSLVPDEIDVSVVVGPWTHEPVTADIRVVSTISGLGPELAQSDVVVTAGGVTMFESLALGRPTIVVVIADNQRRQAEGAASVGAALLSSTADAAHTAAGLLRDVDRRQELSRTASALIDGKGADRIAAAIAELA